MEWRRVTTLKKSCLSWGSETRKTLERVFIIGGKQLGIRIAEMLEAKGVQVKLFEKDLARCEKISTILTKAIVIHGDGTDQSTLLDENIEGVDAFLSLTNHDEDNIIASLLARRLGVKKVVSLINRLSYLPMVQRLGVNTTVSPHLAAVDRILQYVRKGRVLSVTTFGEEEAEAIELIATKKFEICGPAAQRGPISTWCDRRSNCQAGRRGPDTAWERLDPPWRSGHLLCARKCRQRVGVGLFVIGET